jgi:hypothetical protein
MVLSGFNELKYFPTPERKRKNTVNSKICDPEKMYKNM